MKDGDLKPKVGEIVIQNIGQVTRSEGFASAWEGQQRERAVSGGQRAGSIL